MNWMNSKFASKKVRQKQLETQNDYFARKRREAAHDPVGFNKLPADLDFRKSSDARDMSIHIRSSRQSQRLSQRDMSEAASEVHTQNSDSALVVRNRGGRRRRSLTPIPASNHPSPNCGLFDNQMRTEGISDTLKRKRGPVDLEDLYNDRSPVVWATPSPKKSRQRISYRTLQVPDHSQNSFRAPLYMPSANPLINSPGGTAMASDEQSTPMDDTSDSIQGSAFAFVDETPAGSEYYTEQASTNTSVPFQDNHLTRSSVFDTPISHDSPHSQALFDADHFYKSYDWRRVNQHGVQTVPQNRRSFAADHVQTSP